jgi:hypothetical protein
MIKASSTLTNRKMKNGENPGFKLRFYNREIPAFSNE